MAMPNNLVFIRHGESELNYIHRHERDDPSYQKPEGYDQLHDWQFRLSANGVSQAIAAGRWLVEHGISPEDFDHRYVSKFMRARETAAYVGGVACEWKPEDRLKERDWGVYGATPYEDRAEMFPYTEKLRSLSTLFTRLDGGEGLGDSVLLRLRDWLATLHRDAESQDVVAVAHGELMWTARYLIENMLPEEWDEIEEDKTQKIRNATILWYTRQNPVKPGDVRKHLTWRKMIYPNDVDNSPFAGEWREVPGKRYMTGAQLLESVDTIPHLTSEE